MLVDIVLITIPPERQRKDLGELETLKASLRSIGLINPIVVDDNLVLIAGERRLTAAKQLNWEQIEVRKKSDLSNRDRTLIELEENVKRKQLSWIEEVNAVRDYVTLIKEPNNIAAISLGMTAETLSKMVTVANALETLPNLINSPSWSAAYTQYNIARQRELDAAFEDLRLDLEPADTVTALLDKTEEETLLPEIEAKAEDQIPSRLNEDFQVIQADFLEWAKTYSGKRFNFIHCDFPYGLNMGTNNLQNSSARWDTIDERYADTPELFDELVKAFFENQDKFIADSAHCIFWLAHKNVGRLMSRFNYFGWRTCEVPLIWHKSDNAGIAPDPYRWPRRTYEIAIFASRGDRKIVKVKAASYSGPVTKEYHLSEKPVDMLSHFFEMVVDKHTEMLDPTCGSGTALRVAKKFNAKRILGFDVNEKHVKYAAEGVNFDG